MPVLLHDLLCLSASARCLAVSLTSPYERKAPSLLWIEIALRYRTSSLFMLRLTGTFWQVELSFWALYVYHDLTIDLTKDVMIF